MKATLKKIVIAALTICFFNSKAQTVDLQYVSDSTGMFGTICAVPATIGVDAYGQVTGYSPATDSIDVHYYWDDGQDTVVRCNIQSFAADYFFGYASHIYTSPGTYNVMVTATGPGGIADTMFNSPIFLTLGCTSVDGDTYIDVNSNCVFDAGDDTLYWAPIKISDAGGNIVGYGISNAHGHYHVDVPTGLTGLEITPAYYWPYSSLSVTCPATGIYTFNSTGPSTFDFGFDCSASSYDLYAHSASTRVNSPGLDGWVSIYGGNLSCITTPSVVTLTLDPQVTYVSTNWGPAPSSVVGNVLTWNLPSASYLGWYGSFYVNLKINTNVTAVLFDTACFSLSISATASDLNVSNNTDYFCRIIGGPYDPNNKEVSPQGLGASGEIAPNTELTYLVNFQNTGTATAVNININDTINSNLDMATFQILASSHPLTPTIFEGNIVRFDFDNIMLPDSNANEPLSHGWVQYKIKTKAGLPTGTQIKNTAHIYFDYNPAIVTNTTLNTINIALGIEERANAMATLIYPNPAQDKFTVEFSEEVEGILSVVDVTGRVVKTVSVNKEKQVVINTGALSSGLYGLSLPGANLKQNRVQVIK